MQSTAHNISRVLLRWGGISFLVGVAIATCFAALVGLPNLRADFLIPFLGYFTLASAAYLLEVGRLGRDRMPLVGVWGFAILFRLLLLFTRPALSDDVYRYIWDGHLLNQGINPYANAANAPELDAYIIPARSQVNNDWMASPYLSAAQAAFSLVYLISPGSALAFQLLTVLLDLSTGWMVMDLMRGLGQSRGRVLIYLWCPLVAVEFAHGAHIDAWMIFLTVLSFWLLFRSSGDTPRQGRYAIASALALARAGGWLDLWMAEVFLRRRGST